MKVVQDWIDERLKDIADKFPKLVDQDASVFKCGHATGYKQALMDLDSFLEDKKHEWSYVDYLHEFTL